MEQKENRPQSTDVLAQALFIVNKHAKAAPKPQALYELKQRTIEKMLTEGKAKKLGLHFSDNPKYAQQQSDVIVECGNYIFHLPPSKEDMKNLPHLGSRSVNKRNPKTFLSLSKAKSVLFSYIGTSLVEQKTKKVLPKKTLHHQTSNIFPSSFLGKDLYYYKKQ
ncbi:YkyB family protein [Peribacillus acanthi]|uniref:YkyB family protein n=1 Tax=Peribacillus acanthi TaxID=2171554 RepID=UPI000D3E8CC0|nr:YkyB family protein [Peribacillus acanthi]